MNRDAVASSNVVSVGYDESSQTLEVEYLSGGIYQYYDVPITMYEQLMQAGSKGTFMNIYIKKLYAFSRVG